MPQAALSIDQQKHLARTIEEYEHITCAVIEAARKAGMFSGFYYTQFADTFQRGGAWRPLARAAPGYPRRITLH